MHSVRFHAPDRCWRVVSLADPFAAVVIEEVETLEDAVKLCSRLNGGVCLDELLERLESLPDRISLAIEARIHGRK